MQTARFDVDIALLQKYNRPGPRYTSYPTAPHFHEGYGEADFRADIALANEAGTDISLYMHLPFCHSLCYFCGCNMIVTRNTDRVAHYLTYLKREIASVAALLDPARRVSQLHWGGGTPTYLQPDQIRDLFGYIRDHFTFSEGAEISLEIDPRRLSDDHLPALREVGFNRVSFGVQDIHAEVQEAINRIQPLELNAKVIRDSRELGFDSINVDLIYGLPHQSVASYAETLEAIIALDPDRLAVFNYAHVPWLKKHQNVLPEAAMPKTGERLEMLKLIIERLTEAGYAYIGMDHFAKPDDTLTQALRSHTLYRNFQGYSTHSQAEVFAMGITGISQLRNAYAQNVKTTGDYEAALDGGGLPIAEGIRLNADDQLRRYVITELMCNNRVLKDRVQERYGVDFDSYFPDHAERLRPFIEDGLVTLASDRIQVSEAGRLVIRNIAMNFDAYLDLPVEGAKPIYSRTV